MFFVCSLPLFLIKPFLKIKVDETHQFSTHASAHPSKPSTSGMEKHISFHNLEQEVSLRQTFPANVPFHSAPSSDRGCNLPRVLTYKQMPATLMTFISLIPVL